MGFFIVPYDYKEDEDYSIVPICIADVDSSGNLIEPNWVQYGVVPVADPLRKIADRLLNDVWRVSEITERAVHSLSRKHRADLGAEPSHRVLKRAHSYAEELRVGGRRAQRKTEVELFSGKLESMKDQFELVRHLEATEALDRLMEELDRRGMHDVKEMVPMILRDCTASEFEARFGKCRNTLTQRFYRGVRRAARSAGITW